MVGQSTTLTAAVTTGSGSAAGGTVTFYDGSAVLGTGVVGADGQATLTTALRVGSRTLRAVYSGDNFSLGSTSTPLSLTVGRRDLDGPDPFDEYGWRRPIGDRHGECWSRFGFGVPGGYGGVSRGDQAPRHRNRGWPRNREVDADEPDGGIARDHRELSWMQHLSWEHLSGGDRLGRVNSPRQRP